MNKNKIISNIFFIVLVYFPIYATYSYLLSHYELKSFTTKKIDWEKLYPFSHKINEIKKNKITYINYLERINSKLKNKTANIEKKFNNYLPYKYKLSEIQMSISKLLGMNLFLEYDGLVILNNGFLDLYKKDCSFTNSSTKTLDLHNFIKNLHTNFIFVIYPRKNSKYDNQLPKGLKDNKNIACDEFLSVLNKNKVDTLDLRENITKDYKSQYDMFFRTDHHWKPSSGLWAAREISKKINSLLDWEIDTSLLNNEIFKETIIPNFFLGSQGRKITLAYVEPDNFSILEPNHDTNYKRICPTWGQDKTGSFSQVMFDYNRIESCDYYTKFPTPYYFYLHSDIPYLRLINNSKNIYDKKVCLIKDSFNNVVAPFLSLGIKDLTLLDTRYFTGSIRTFLEKEKFDLVILAYNVDAILLGESKLFKFD